MRPALLVAAVVAGTACLWSSQLRAEAPTVLRPTETIEVQPERAQQKPPVITAVAVVPGGTSVATAGDDHVIRIWNTSSGQLQHKLATHSDWVRALAFSPDGQQLASAGDDHRIVFWEVATGQKLHIVPAHPHVIYSLAYSPDGKWLATVGFEPLVRIYDTASRQLHKELTGPDADLRAVAFSPDGARLAAAGRNGMVRVWNVPTGDVARDIASAGLGRLRALAWLPDGQKLATAGENRIVSVFDAQSGAALHRIQCQTGKLLSMVVCGENLIATGGSDNAVRVWNWQTETEADHLLGHTGSVASLAFDSVSGSIISGSFDTTVRVWKLRITGSGQDTAVEVDQESRVR